MPEATADGTNTPDRSAWRRTVPSPRIAVELARVELRRTARWTAGQDYWLLYMAISAFGLLFGSWRAFALGRGAGRALATGGTTWFLTGGAWTLWATIWVFLAVLTIAHVVGSNGDVDHDGHYLTLRPAADIVAGKLLAAACGFAVFVFVPAFACFLGLAIGQGTPAPFLGGLAATVVTVATATAVGVPMGFTLKGGIRRSTALTRLKPVLAVAVGVAYLLVMLTGEIATVIEQLRPVLQSPPLGWLAALSLSTTPGAGASAIGAIGALLGGGATVVASTLLAVPAARYAWQTDRVRPENEVTEAVAAPTHRLDRVLGAIARTPATRAVANTTLRRVYRSPLQLVFVAVPLVAAIPVADALLAAEGVPWYAPWLAVWYGAWAAGAAVPLNPLGNQGATLPSLLTAPADGQQVVRGYVLAAAFPVAPPTAVLATALGAGAGRSSVALMTVTIAAVALVIAATVLAVGVGSLFPRFETLEITGSRRAIPPSKVAYSAFSTVLTLAVAAVVVVHDDVARRIVAVLVSRRLPIDLTGNAAVLTPIAWGVLVAVIVGVPLAYRLAVRRIDRHHLS